MKRLLLSTALLALLAAGSAVSPAHAATTPLTLPIPITLPALQASIHALAGPLPTAQSLIEVVNQHTDAQGTLHVAVFAGISEGQQTDATPFVVEAECATVTHLNGGSQVQVQVVIAEPGAGSINPASRMGLVYPTTANGLTTLAEGSVNTVQATSVPGVFSLPGGTADSVNAYGAVFTDNTQQKVLRGGIGMGMYGPIYGADTQHPLFHVVGYGSVPCEATGIGPGAVGIVLGSTR